MIVPPEINREAPEALLLVGRDPGRTEVEQGRPFVGKAGRLLDQALAEAGLRRHDCNFANVCGVRPPGNVFAKHRRDDVRRGQQDLADLIRRLRPNCVVALGNEAAFSCVPAWPSRSGDVFGAYGIEDRRGYIWGAEGGQKVVATVHPAACDRVWVPWRALLTMDLKRAKREAASPALDRPARNVDVITRGNSAAEVLWHLDGQRRVAFDIELDDGGTTLACVGFAARPEQSYVMLPDTFHEVFAWLQDEDRLPTLIAANGQFDLHFLFSRHGVRCRGFADDTQIAWHACYPELAGRSEQKSSKMTRKSLAFLASIFTRDEWWKDYEFESEEQRYVLNGRDCCITLEVMEKLDELIDSLGVRAIYDHGIGLVWPVVEMQARGLRVDEVRRQSRIDALDERLGTRTDEVERLALPILERHKDRLTDVWHLFEERQVCSCCRNGKNKRDACWSCAGLPKKPGKKQLESAGLTLSPCKVCDGRGSSTMLSFNPHSNPQKIALLYEALKLPRRHSGGKLSVDEEKLKSLLAEVSEGD